MTSTILSPGFSSPKRWMMRLACKVPAGERLGFDALELGLGHARIVLERHRGDRVAAGLAAHGAGEGDDGADIGAAGRQTADLGADVEVLGLDANRHVSLP